MDWRNNVFVGSRVKYEQVYLRAYDSVAEARASIMQYVDWYTDPGPRLSLGRETPDETYAVLLPTVEMAA
ncbi:transposase [Nitrosospira sp. Nsp14]|uniref:transposase n=1 Tax=Nitrosospira sp. Nsp14 TaxID=1855333 RepID=UPI0011605063